MNICLFLISGGWGGAENVVYNLAKFTQKKGHKVSIILDEETYSNFTDLEGVNLYSIGPVFDYQKFIKENFNISLPKFFVGKGTFSKGFRFVLGPLLRHLNYRKIKGNILDIINEINPDIIHFHNPVVLDFYPYIYKKIDCIKIYTAHGREFRGLCPTDKFKKRKLIMSFDRITTVSDFMKRYLKSHGIRGTIDVIYNGLDLNYIESIKSEIGMKNDSDKNNNKKFKLLFPGGVKLQKGGGELIKAVNILKNSIPIKLFIAGNVPKDHKYRKMVRNYRIQKYVEFLGFLDKKKYFTYLNSADCLVLPSEKEAFGIVFLEAMAMGKPIIGSNEGGAIEVIKNKINGLLCTRTPEDIARSIIFLYKHPKLREEISKNNIKDAKKYDWNKIVGEYMVLYQSLIKG